MGGMDRSNMEGSSFTSLSARVDLCLPILRPTPSRLTDGSMERWRSVARPLAITTQHDVLPYLLCRNAVSELRVRLDMFGEQIEVPYPTRESMRLKYTR